MDVERVNAVLVKAITGFQEAEIEAMSEALAIGVSSYEVTWPHLVGDRVKIRASILAYLKKIGKKVNKTNLRKLLKNYELPETLGFHHIGQWQGAIRAMIQELKSLKDYKRELAKLEKAQGEVSRKGAARGHKTPTQRISYMASFNSNREKIDALKQKIAELGG